MPKAKPLPNKMNTSDAEAVTASLVCSLVARTDCRTPRIRPRLDAPACALPPECSKNGCETPGEPAHATRRAIGVFGPPHPPPTATLPNHGPTTRPQTGQLTTARINTNPRTHKHSSRERFCGRPETTAVQACGVQPCRRGTEFSRLLPLEGADGCGASVQVGGLLHPLVLRCGANLCAFVVG